MRFAMDRIQEAFLPATAEDALTGPAEKYWDPASPGFGPKLSPAQPGLMLPYPTDEKGRIRDEAIYPLLDPRRGQPALERWQFNDLYVNPDSPYPGA